MTQFGTSPSTHPLPLPAWERIEEAMGTIDPIFLNSPCASSELLNEALGCKLIAKVETINPIRSFKGRGASYFVRTLPSGDDRKLVASSAGNFGQGLAYAASAAGRSLTVYSATTANPDKVASMRRLGAIVVQEGRDFDAAKAAATRFANLTGGYLVVDGDEPAIAEGAGTIALELLRDWSGERLDAVLVPLGNGALVTGVGTWLKHESPDTRIVAVGALGAPAMARSWRSNSRVVTSDVSTIADGIAIRVPDLYALDSMRSTVDEVAEVTEDSLITAMRLVHRHLGLVVEPSGAAGIAAILDEPDRWAGSTVGTVLCGSNIDQKRAAEWLHEPLA